MDRLTIVTLNVCYDPRIEITSPYHFNQRWPHIQANIQSHAQGDTQSTVVIALQEVHTDFLEKIHEFATLHNYTAITCLYHEPRQTHLVTLVQTARYISSGTHSAPGTSSKMVSVLIELPSYTTEGGDHYEEIYCTVFNVHFPLDIYNTGERLRATKTFLRTMTNTNQPILVGDWNTLPNLGGFDQLDMAAEMGTLVKWSFPQDAPRSTFWGYPHETDKELHGFNSPTVLDHLLVGRGIGIVRAECKHIFIDIEGIHMMLSDHALCVAQLHILRN